MLHVLTLSFPPRRSSERDAPAHAAADVGIAMGTETDVDMEGGGVTLVRGDLLGVAQAIRLSRAAMRNIRQNLIFAFGYNTIGIPIAAGDRKSTRLNSSH